MKFQLLTKNFFIWVIFGGNTDDKLSAKSNLTNFASEIPEGFYLQIPESGAISAAKCGM